MVLAVVVSVLGASGPDGRSDRLGGDFPAFHAAGDLALAGEWSDLYDPDRQAEAQAALFPDDEGAFLYFAYPPYVAALYAPLAALDYRLAYAIHTVAMVAAMIGALVLIRPMVPLLKRHFETVAIVTLLFFPMLRAVTGGQNTSLTVLLLAGVWRSVADDRDVVAGLLVALLLFKPQFAVPLIGLLFVARRFGAVAAACVGAGALWSVGAVTMGVGWLAPWWREVSAFAELDADVNGHNAVSWFGFAEGAFGAGSLAAAIVAAPLMVATGALLMRRWDPSRLPGGPDDRGATWPTTFAVTVAGLVLLSPHAMFYDAGLLVLVGIVVVDRLGRAAAVPVVTVWVAAWLQLAAESLGFAPLFFVVVAASIWTTWALSRQPEPSPLLA